MKGTILYKLSGSGNDFVMLDGRSTGADEWSAARIAAVCDRRTGIGADGLVVLTPEEADTVRMVYWNSDGSRAAMCGNAALCSARLVAYLEMVAGDELRLLTDAGPVRARAHASGDCAEVKLPDFEVEGTPGIAVGEGECWIGFATVGVPHLVVRVDDIEKVEVARRGQALRFDSSLGKQGANVNFVAPTSGGRWLIRTYERGVEGETLACGTGTVAAAVVLAQRGEAHLPATFQTRGGPELRVRAQIDGSQASDVWLGGQGKLVFRAVWEG